MREFLRQAEYNREHPMVYIACSMTGQDRVEMISKAKAIKFLFEMAGFRVFHPALEEKVPNIPGKLEVDDKLIDYWQRDKWAIRRSIAVIDSSADLKSEGREHEVGLMRYGYWRPVIRISPKHASGFHSIGKLEDDAIVGTPEEAVALVKELYCPWKKRFIWRCKLYNRCLLRAVYEQVRGFFL